MENRTRIKGKGLVVLLTLLTIGGCKNRSVNPTSEPKEIEKNIEVIPDTDLDYDNTQWEEVTYDNSEILVDIKYATTDNFTKQVIYDCPRCFLRPEISKALIQLNQGILERHGLRLKVWDCYRPLPAQQKLWDIVPNASYVTPPAKGSMHNRGMAVDITLVDKDGNEIDMGTPYDYFGEEAHIDNENLPSQVLSNRNMLQVMMKEIGFKTIRTEWWHFSYTGEMQELSDWEWVCE